MNFFKVASFSAFLALAGCQDLNDKFTQMASEKPINLVIGPGYRVVANNETAMVFGFEDCPQNHPMMQKVFGDDTKQSACVVITPKTKKVLVRLIFNDRILTEEWKVVRETGKSLIYLTRPNGSPIEQYSENNNPVNI